MVKIKKAVILHRVEDAKNCIGNNLHYDCILFSTNSSVDTYLKYEHNIDCKCLSYFLDEQCIIKEIKNSCSETDSILKELDMQFSAAINKFYGFENISFFKSLYSYGLKCHLADYKTILAAVDTVIEQYNLEHLSVYELKDEPIFGMYINIKDLFLLLSKKIPVDIIPNAIKPERKYKYKRIFRVPQKVLPKIYEYIRDLKFLFFKKGRDTILLHEGLYDLAFLKNRLKNFNIIYYKGDGKLLFSKKKQRVDVGKFGLDIESKKDSLTNLIKNEIKGHFENKINNYISVIKSLEALHKRYNIKLAISGNSPVFGVKPLIFEYLKSKNVPIMIGAHGFNYGLQDVFRYHFDTDYNWCDYFISYGFTKNDLLNLYGEEAKSIKCRILPYGSKMIRQAPETNARKREKIDILFPITMNKPFFLGKALARTRPDLLTEIQIKLLHYLDTKKKYSIVVKPMISYYDYSGCSVIPVLKRLKNVQVIDYLSFFDVLEKFDVKSVLIDYISTALGETIPRDIEIFAFGSSMDFIEPNVLELLKKRIHYATDVAELIKYMDLFLEKELSLKRDDGFLKRYLIKENTQENILNMINHLVKMSNTEG